MCSYSEISGQIDLVLFNSLCTVLWVHFYDSFLSETGATGATDVYETIKSSKDSQEGIRRFQTEHLNSVFCQ